MNGLYRGKEKRKAAKKINLQFRHVRSEKMIALINTGDFNNPELIECWCGLLPREIDVGNRFKN